MDSGTEFLASREQAFLKADGFDKIIHELLKFSSSPNIVDILILVCYREVKIFIHLIGVLLKSNQWHIFILS